MKILASVSVFGLSVFLSMSASAAMSTPNCTAMWNKADTNNDGILVGIETSPYVMAMTEAEMKPVKARVISIVEFMTACEDGAFRRMTM